MAAAGRALLGCAAAVLTVAIALVLARVEPVDVEVVGTITVVPGGVDVENCVPLTVTITVGYSVTVAPALSVTPIVVSISTVWVTGTTSVTV